MFYALIAGDENYCGICVTNSKKTYEFAKKNAEEKGLPIYYDKSSDAPVFMFQGVCKDPALMELLSGIPKEDIN